MAETNIIVISKSATKRTRLQRLRDPRRLRPAVQAGFLLLCLWIGLEFYWFMKWGQSGGAAAFHPRPPGAEGFLPISALISLKYWLQSGILNDIHPSGLFILLAVIAVSLLLKKAFCSWLCPIGTLSESLWRIGRSWTGRNLVPPRWLDLPLRSLKYLLLLFFVWAIAGMDVAALKNFVYSPYNRMADVKMYLFFADISTLALWVIATLVLLSVFIKNFWCRYLCPYGALLGPISWLSPLKITRRLDSCIDCQLCTKACPAMIQVHAAGRVRSDECTACLDCVAVCPVKDTLGMSVRREPRWIPAPVFAALVVGIFVAVVGAAMLAGRWQNSIPQQEYLRRFREIDSPYYNHARGQVMSENPAPAPAPKP